MPSTYSSNLKLELMATGENSGTWGNITNTNLGTAAEQAIVGLGNVDYVSDANLTISITNSNAAQAARALVLNVTSSLSLTGTRELVVPTIEKQYIVQNNTTGGQSITVKTSAGTGITVPNGRKAHLYVDGTNVIQMFDFVDINGGTIDGTPIGGSSAAAGSFTTLGASGAATFNGAVTLGDAAADLIVFNGTVNSHLLFTDNTYDIGANGATRPRNLFLAGAATIGGNLSVGGTLTLTGGVNLNGNVTVGDSSADTLTINSTITSNLLFTDNTYDIGASGATRPRNLFLAGNATIGGATTMTGALTVDSTTDSSSTTTGSIQTDGGLGVAKNVYIGGTTVSQTNSATVSHSVVSTGGNALLNLDANTGAGAFSPQLSFKSSGTSKWAIGGGNIGSGGANDFGMYDYANGKLTYSVLATGGSMLMNTNLLFVDNTYDIGASGNSRPRDLYLSGSISVNLGAVFNELGGDYDFRVESDANTHALFLDATVSRIGINNASPATSLAMFGATDVTLGASISASGWNNALHRWTVPTSGDTSVWSFNYGGSAVDFASYATSSIQVGQGTIILGTGAVNTAPVEKVKIGVSETVVNEQGLDYDFRVESDTKAYMLFVDAGNNRVAVGTSGPVSPFDVYTGADYVTLTTSDGVGSADGFGLQFRIDTQGHVVGQIRGQYYSSGSNGYGGTHYYTRDAGTLIKSMSLAPPLYGGSVFNEDGLDIDFRVESDNNTHALFVDAGSDAVTINTSTVRSSANLTIASTTLRPGVVIGKGYSYGQPNYHINTRDDIAGTTYPSTYYAQIEGAGIISNGGYYFGGALRQLDSAATAMIELQFINGGLQLRRDTGATAGSQLAISNPDVVFDTNGYAFNEAGIANYDFRVESDAQTHMLFVDAGNNCVNINETSNLGGKLNVNGAIITDSNHRVHIALPYFNFGAGGIADEYWVLARRYVGSAIQASGLMGRIIGSRGSTTSGNIASYQNIICQSAYLSNEVPGLDNQGLTANFEAIDIISISGVEYYAARARTSGGPCDNGLYFEGFMVNNTGDTNVFTATRASTAGVSVITTNVATLNSWVFRDTYLQAQRAGYDRITISGTETNFNDPGLDYDFRVESDTNTHALFVDAGNAAVRLADQVVFSATDAIGDPVGVVWAKPIGVNYTSNNGPTSYTIRLSCASIGEYFAIIRVVGLDPYADTGYYRYEAQVVGYLSSGIGTVISTNETPNQSVSFSTPTFAANQVNIPVTASGTNYRFQVTAEIYPRGAAATTRAFALSIV